MVLSWIIHIGTSSFTDTTFLQAMNQILYKLNSVRSRKMKNQNQEKVKKDINICHSHKLCESKTFLKFLACLKIIRTKFPKMPGPVAKVSVWIRTGTKYTNILN